MAWLTNGGTFGPFIARSHAIRDRDRFKLVRGHAVHDAFVMPEVSATGVATPLRGRTLSVVIPMLNEERGLDALVAQLTPALDRCGLTWDVVFVDDGSTDRTRDMLRSLNRRDPRLKAISFSRNFGKERAIAAGLDHAHGDAVVIMDADLQHPPSVILQFIDKWNAGFDVVYAQRDDRVEDGLARRAFSVGFYGLFKAMSGTSLPDGAGDFRLLDKKAVAAMRRFGERARFTKGLYAWIGFKSTGVVFHVPPRHDGTKSRFNPRALWRFAMDGIVSFTTMPLRVWSYVGVAVSMLAFAYIALFLLKYMIYGSDTAGFPTLIVSILFLGGIQLISLGVIGEYLGRMYEEVKGRPLYLVETTIGDVHAARDSETAPPQRQPAA